MIPRRRLTSRSRGFAPWLRPVFLSDRARSKGDVAVFERAAGIRPGDEVIMPAWTRGELAALVQDRGYRPVAADIKPDTLNIDLRSIEAHIGPANPGDRSPVFLRRVEHAVVPSVCSHPE